MECETIAHGTQKFEKDIFLFLQFLKDFYELSSWNSSIPPIMQLQIKINHILSKGYYTQYRRQLRGQMRCYEDDGYQFVRNEPEIMELLKLSSIFALSSIERVKLVRFFF